MLLSVVLLSFVQIEYPWRLLINPVDTCIDALVIRGALQMSRFLSGDPVPAIAWLEQKQGEVGSLVLAGCASPPFFSHMTHYTCSA